jgi:hypothetical protein
LSRLAGAKLRICLFQHGAAADPKELVTVMLNGKLDVESFAKLLD